MPTNALARDSLRADVRGTVLAVALPWIRSMPLWCVRSAVIDVDGTRVEARIDVDGRLVSVAALKDEDAWWFLQDRLEFVLDRHLAAGRHDVAIALGLLIPYLPGAGSDPLVVPLVDARALELGAEQTP